MKRLDKIFVGGGWYTIISNGSDYPLFITGKNGYRYYFDPYEWKFLSGAPVL